MDISLERKQVIKRQLEILVDSRVDIREGLYTNNIVIEIAKYTPFSVTFCSLMRVAEILGTTKFSINDEWRENDPGTPNDFIRMFWVKKEDIDTGVPWSR